MYNVYSITDGIVESEESFDDYESALYYFGDLVRNESDTRDTKDDYVETTVHLFDGHESSMNLLHDVTIEVRA